MMDPQIQILTNEAVLWKVASVFVGKLYDSLDADSQFIVDTLRAAKFLMIASDTEFIVEYRERD